MSTLTNNNTTVTCTTKGNTYYCEATYHINNKLIGLKLITITKPIPMSALMVIAKRYEYGILAAYKLSN